MINECAICYGTDIHFMLPSIISAVGIRRFVPQHKADIFIFLIDGDKQVSSLNKALASYAIQIISMSGTSLINFDTSKFNPTGLPLSALARFFIDDLLPVSCRRVIYIDGDTWIRQDPSPLIEAIVPDGKFAAADDMVSFRFNGLLPHSKQTEAYFAGLGLKRGDRYFNSGLFAATRQTWRSLAAEAFKFLADNTKACKFHDQSALNAVVGDRRLCLSLKWNFQTPYRLLSIEPRINPHIYHFTRFPKPWMGECEPWPEIYPPYLAALAPFANLHLPIKKLDEAALNMHTQRSWKKKALQHIPFTGKIAEILLGINAYEKTAWL